MLGRASDFRTIFIIPQVQGLHGRVERIVETLLKCRQNPFFGFFVQGWNGRGGTHWTVRTGRGRRI